MSTMLQKHKLLSLALIACFSMTACGAKKDVVSAPPAPQQTEPTVTGDTESTDGTLGGGLPAPYNGDDGEDSEGGNDGTLPPAPIPPDDPYSPNPIPDSTPDEDSGDDEGEDYTPPPSDSDSIPGYVSNDPKSFDRSPIKRLTGGKTSDGSVYTSTSTDQLLTYLQQRNSRVNHESRTLNIAAARSVEFAQLSAEKRSNEVTITLKVREGDDLRVYNLAGALKKRSGATEVHSVDFANGYETTGRREISGTLKCVDADGGCENVFARLRIGTSPKAAIFNVIFRSSTADVYFSLPGKFSDSREYARIREMVHNSIKKKDSSNRLRAVKMNSWEVVHGRSGVSLHMLAYNDEYLGFSGPLLAPESGTGVDLRLGRLSSIPEGVDDLRNSGEVKLNYANYIGDARLVGNNGLGQLRIALKMRKRDGYKPEVFRITLMRQIKPIVELTDDNLL